VGTPGQPPAPVNGGAGVLGGGRPTVVAVRQWGVGRAGRPSQHGRRRRWHHARCSPCCPPSAPGVSSGGHHYRWRVVPASVGLRGGDGGSGVRSTRPHVDRGVCARKCLPAGCPQSHAGRACGQVQRTARGGLADFGRRGAPGRPLARRGVFGDRTPPDLLRGALVLSRSAVLPGRARGRVCITACARNAAPNAPRGGRPVMRLPPTRRHARGQRSGWRRRCTSATAPTITSRGKALRGGVTAARSSDRPPRRGGGGEGAPRGHAGGIAVRPP